MTNIYQRTFCLLKPDCLERGLMLPILNEMPFSILKARLFTPFRDIWTFHYHEHKGKEFYDRLCAHMASGPVFGMIVGGVDGIALTRQFALAMREKYGGVGPRNLIHTSDGIDGAAYELKLWEPNL
jgi:nucleoside-diphosphate kinase